jgi:hypothetical protein
MQVPTEEAEASISTENMRKGPNVAPMHIPSDTIKVQKPTEEADPCGMNSQNRDNEVAPMHIPSDTITMQGPTEEAEASISTENMEEGPNLHGAFTEHRKAAKRTLPWDLASGELRLVAHIPARKKPRIEEPLATTTDESASKNASPDISVGFPRPAVDYHVDVDADPVNGTWAIGRWTPEEDAKLNSAVMNTCKMKHGKEYRTNWVAIVALVPGRTRKQCRSRWHDVFNPSIALTSGHEGKWTEDEDSKLKDAVQRHGGKNWGAIAALVSGRTEKQCWNRWHNALDPSIDWANGRTGKWTAVEDIKLKDAVQTHGGRNWISIALVPGRTEKQCWNRWHNAVNPSIALMDGRERKWTVDENSKLKDAAETHGGRNWGRIAALVPGRTNSQCRNRWHNAVNPSIALTAGREGVWTEEEDSKLKDTVQTHGGKNWDAIAVLVSGRTSSQCRNGWHNAFNPSIALTAGREGTWTEDEDSKLKDAVQRYGGKKWGAIAVLVPGRTGKQCWNRWHNAVNPSIALKDGREGTWTVDENSKLKDAVQTHGDKNW